jgi:hypothetical protein
MNDDYSQAGQDRFVMSLIKNPTSQPYFLDIGCHLPRHLNNTLLLEENGWFGLSLDILDFHKEWTVRKCPFIQADALTYDYKRILEHYGINDVVDYLNVDIEGEGLRFKALEQVFKSGYDFKIITIEHDSYRGYVETEAKPQYEFLSKRGYHLVCKDVKLTGNPFEDWWVNPKYFQLDEYKHLISDGLDYNDILKKIR